MLGNLIHLIGTAGKNGLIEGSFIISAVMSPFSPINATVLSIIYRICTRGVNSLDGNVFNILLIQIGSINSFVVEIISSTIDPHLPYLS